MTSGLRRQEISAPHQLYRNQKQPRVAGKPFWPVALVERIRAVVHAVAPIGYEDESGFCFGEQPARRKTVAGDEVDSDG
jgi:hypothetical protein